MRNHNNKICLSPFKEINCGSEYIYDYVKDGYTVPDKVIAYLRNSAPSLVCPGVLISTAMTMETGNRITRIASI